MNIAVTPSKRREKKAVHEALLASLPDKPFKLKLRHQPWLKLRQLIAGLVLSVFAIGLYYVIFETHLALGPLGRVLVGLGAVIFVAALVATISLAITGRTISTGKKTWRMVTPGMVVGLVVGGIGLLILRAHYMHPHVVDTTALWHFEQPVDFIRHGWRKLGEGVLIIIGAMSYGYNSYGLRRLKALARGPRWYDKVEMFMRIPNMHDDDYRTKRQLPQMSGWQVLTTLCFWQFLYAGLVIWPLLHLVHHFQQYNINSAGPSWVQFITEPLTGPTVYLVIGVISGRAARRPVAPVVTELNRWRAQKFVASQHTLNWVHNLLLSPYYIERIKRTEAKGVTAAKQALRNRSNVLVFAMSGAGLVFLVIWGTGLWVKIKYGAS